MKFIGPHKWLESWPGKPWWMRATMPLHPPASISPSMGIRSLPNQTRKNCKTSLKIGETTPDSHVHPDLQRGNHDAENRASNLAPLSSPQYCVHISAGHQDSHERKRDDA